jgi:hypothetical protein
LHEVANLLEKADEGLCEFVKHTAHHGRDTAIDERDGLLLVAGSHPAPGPYRNMAFRYKHHISAQAAIRRADAFFNPRRRSYVLWVHDHGDEDLLALAAERGWEPLEKDGLLEMVMYDPPEPADPPEGVNVLPAASEVERRDFLRVNAQGWGMGGISDEAAAAMFFEPSSLDAPNVAGVIAYQDHQPVSTAMAIVHREAVGGYWGATIPEARRQGLSDVVVRQMFISGFELGGEVAVFQASGMGERIWRAMGAQDLSRYWRFLVTAALVAYAMLVVLSD